MAYKEKEITKLYYSIGEVAEILDLSTSLIRYWENEFPMLSPRKNRKGNRMFTDKDIDQVRLIYHLVKERGFTLDGAKRRLRENKEETINKYKAVQSLQKIRTFLVQMKENLDEQAQN